jgi:hypothetical protein
VSKNEDSGWSGRQFGSRKYKSLQAVASGRGGGCIGLSWDIYVYTHKIPYCDNMAQQYHSSAADTDDQMPSRAGPKGLIKLEGRHVVGAVIVTLPAIAVFVTTAMDSIKQWAAPMMSLLESASHSYSQEPYVHDDFGFGPNHLVWDYCKSYCMSAATYHQCSIEQFNNQPCLSSDSSTAPANFSASKKDIVCVGATQSGYECFSVNSEFRYDLKNYLSINVLSLVFVLVFLSLDAWFVYCFWSQNGPSTGDGSMMESKPAQEDHGEASCASMSDTDKLLSQPFLGTVSQSSDVHRTVLDAENGTIKEPKYASVIPARTKKLFGTIEVSSQAYGFFTFGMQIWSVASLLISVSSNMTIANISMLEVAVLHVLISFVCIPLWQNYHVQKNPSGEDVRCEEQGCVCCRLCFICWSLPLGFYKFVPRECSEHTEECLFVPCSLYNSWFMFRNPGKELNRSLPADLEQIGYGRATLALFSVNIRAAFNMYILSNAAVSFVLISIDGFGISAAFALMSLLSSASSLQKFIMTTLYGFALICLTMSIALLFCWPDNNGKLSKFAQVHKDGWVYPIITQFWKDATEF